MPVKITPLPPLAYLRELFELDRETGALRWRERPVRHFKNEKYSAERSAVMWNAAWAGKRAGSIGSDGRRSVMIDGRRYRAARIVYALYHGADPGDAQIDHIDRDRSNDRPDNLRLATSAENAQNQGRSPRNTSGLTGIYWNSARRKWQAQISVADRMRNLGRFDRAADAYAAYYHAKLAEAGAFAPRDLPLPGSLMANVLARIADQSRAA